MEQKVLISQGFVLNLYVFAHGHYVQEGGLLLDKTANHFFFFCQRRGRACCQKCVTVNLFISYNVVLK